MVNPGARSYISGWVDHAFHSRLESHLDEVDAAQAAVAAVRAGESVAAGVVTVERLLKQGLTTSRRSTYAGTAS
jgi:hypothetical protein